MKIAISTDFNNIFESCSSLTTIGNVSSWNTSGVTNTHRANKLMVEEEFKNTILLYQLEKDTEKTLNFVCDNLITDVYFINGEYCLLVKDREELAGLFEDK